MLRTTASLLALLIAMPVAVWAASSAPAQLELHTQDDDLRAGGTVWLVLRMQDGTEQSQILVNGPGLAGSSSANYQVAPRAPYDWSKVRELGIRFRPHPGDGLLLQPDQWRVYVVLRGSPRCGTATSVPPGEVCFGHHNGRLAFEREGTQWIPFRAVIGRCNGDADCNASDDFCAERTHRCAPTGGDAMGCVALPRPQLACLSGQSCDEAQNRCVVPGCESPDLDRDGADSLACGGGDCDDRDARRYPGNVEICDAEGHDEDCDPRSIGSRDSDRDGFVDAACWNDGAQF